MKRYSCQFARDSALAALVLIAFSVGIVKATTKGRCSQHPKLSGPCFKVRGRLAFYDGSPSVRIWPIGTNRILGVSEGRYYLEEFENLPSGLTAGLTFETAMYADFTVCPFTPEEPGVMRLVCVDSAENIKVRKRQ
jgi:hypothetical protein